MLDSKTQKAVNQTDEEQKKAERWFTLLEQEQVQLI